MIPVFAEDPEQAGFSGIVERVPILIEFGDHEVRRAFAGTPRPLWAAPGRLRGGTRGSEPSDTGVLREQAVGTTPPGHRPCNVPWADTLRVNFVSADNREPMRLSFPGYEAVLDVFDGAVLPLERSELGEEVVVLVPLACD